MSLRSIGGYRITRELGRGGMGTVYQALSAEGATVAVKTVVWPDTVDPRARWNAIERFQREARAARSLSHPNICRVLDFGADENSLFIVMEFLDGDTVRQLIDLAGKIELGRAVPIVRDVGEALAHAHGKGIIQRDIKPGNIMVLRNGQVKLADFGLAFVVHETGVSRTAETMGTLFYLSPEQVRGDRVDARSDIFSLGATFCEMVTGTHAFSGESPAAVMHQILTGDPALAKDLPDSVCRLLEKCLRKDPQERFQSAREITDCLSMWERAAAPTPTAVLPKEEPKAARSRWRRLAQLPRALRGWRAVAAAAAVLAVGALAWLRSEARSRGGPTAAAVSSAEFSAVARFPPSLRPVEKGLVATYVYGAAGRIEGIATRGDGTLLVTVGAADGIAPGVYLAREGGDCDPSDAYARPGKPFDSPSGIAMRPDGGVLVADPGAGTVWVIPAPGARAQVLTQSIPSPCDVLVAPPGFDGPNVDPGDVLVCASRSAEPERFGLYVVDRETSSVHTLVGPPELQNGLLYAAFGPDGTLYAVEDDNSRDGYTIVTVSPDGRCTPLVGNLWRDLTPFPQTGPVAVHPVTGQVFFAYRSTIYRLAADGKTPQEYAVGGLEITALDFSPDGSALLASDAKAQVVAKIAPYPVEGKLLVAGWCQAGPQSGEPQSAEFCYVLEGRSNNKSLIPVRPAGDLSPLGDEVAYEFENDYPGDKPWRKRCHILRADLAGQVKANLTEPIGVRAINCCPQWSPDGRRISFLHCDPDEGVKPCETGLDVWVMNADGTQAQRLVRPDATAGLGSESFPERWWSANGDRVIYRYGHNGQVMSVDLDGTDPQVLPVFSGNISPDGSKIVDERTEPDVVDGERGVWRQLCLADADGAHTRVLLQHFVKDSDVAKNLHVANVDLENPRWADDVREWVGPKRVKWSPDGNRVAFLAALPFEPDGDTYYFQVEAWIYDLSTGILVRLTDNTDAENGLSWRGCNTHRDHPRVTVGNTTVAFATVTKEGVTTVTRDDDPPPRPGGYRFCGDYYDMKTTAQYRGPVKIAMTYADEDVPGGDENALAILHYVEASGKWKDITISRDTKANTVTGQADSIEAERPRSATPR